MKLLKLLFLTIILGSLSSCEKSVKTDPDALPKESQTGAIMFACRVNGTKWVPAKKMDIDGSFDRNVITVKGSVFFSDSFEGLDIEIKNPGTRKTFLLDGSDGEGVVFFTSNKKCFNGATGYGVGQAQSTSGTLVLTKLDVDNKIISGTFSCQIPTDACGTLKITEGRFDIRYY